MMQRGLVTHSIKVEVLQMLKQQIVDSHWQHGDIKDFLVLREVLISNSISKTKK